MSVWILKARLDAAIEAMSGCRMNSERNQGETEAR